MHLISWEDLTEIERSAARRCKPITLCTANGKAVTDFVTDIYVQQLDMTLEFNILDDVPPILCLGKLVIDHEFRYIWDQNISDLPYLEVPEIKKDGTAPTDSLLHISNIALMENRTAPLQSISTLSPGPCGHALTMSTSSPTVSHRMVRCATAASRSSSPTPRTGGTCGGAY